MWAALIDKLGGAAKHVRIRTTGAYHDWVASAEVGGDDPGRLASEVLLTLGAMILALGMIVLRTVSRAGTTQCLGIVRVGEPTASNPHGTSPMDKHAGLGLSDDATPDVSGQHAAPSNPMPRVIQIPLIGYCLEAAKPAPDSGAEYCVANDHDFPDKRISRALATLDRRLKDHAIPFLSGEHGPSLRSRLNQCLVWMITNDFSFVGARHILFPPSLLFGVESLDLFVAVVECLRDAGEDPCRLRFCVELAGYIVQNHELGFVPDAAYSSWLGRIPLLDCAGSVRRGYALRELYSAVEDNKLREEYIIFVP